MQKYLGKTIEFIPEVYKNEYLVVMPITIYQLKQR